MKNALRNFKVSKAMVSAMAVSAVAMGTCVSTFADAATVTAMGAAMEPVKTDALSALATVAPYGIAIMGAFLVWKYGTRFFKSIAK